MLESAESLTRPRRITPAKRRVRLRDIVRHRQLIRVMAARDFKAKYKQSVLGMAWVVIQPAGLLVGFVVAFGRHAAVPHDAGIPYAVFALSGLCVWSYFQAAMVMGTASIIGNFALVKRTPCPRVAFPASSLIATTPSLAIVLLAAVVTTAATGQLSARVLLLPLGVIWLLLLTGAVVSLTCSLAIYVRDVVNALPLVLQIGVFMAPIGYALGSVSGILHAVVIANPVTGLIEAWRWMLMSGYSPDGTAVILAAVETVLIAVVGWDVFTRLEPSTADRI